MSRHRSIGPLLAWTAITAAGCGDASPGSEGHYVVTDSAGVRIVTTVELEWPDDRVVALRPLRTFPRAGDDAATPLSRVVSAVPTADGGLLLADSRLRTVIRYEPDGRERFAEGTTGDGPGEFRGIRSLQPLEGGQAEVYDFRHGRLTRFTPAGDVAQVQTLEVDGPPPQNAWRTVDGATIAWVPTDIRNALSEAATGRVVTTSATLVRLHRDGSQDTIIAGHNTTILRSTEGGIRVWEHPYGRSTRLEYDPAGARVLVAWNERHQIEAWSTGDDPVGGLRTVFRYPAADGPIAREELAGMRDKARALLRVEGQDANQLDLLYEDAVQPALRPAFRRLIRAPDGTVWAQRFEPLREAAPLWWIISPEGAFRGRVRMPAGAEPVGFGHGVMVVRQLDAFDVPHLLVVADPIAELGAA